MQSHEVQVLTLIASGAVLGKRAVKWTGDQGGEDDAIAGLARHGAADGEAVAVVTLGTARAIAGDEISVGDQLGVDADGALVPIDGVTYTQAVARALEAAAAAGAEIEVFLLPH
jgi:hypothetical protein